MPESITSSKSESPKSIFELPAQEAPCQQACPAGIDVPQYVRLVREGKFADALAVICEKIPFPSVCGWICAHPCEVECRVCALSEPVTIRAIKRFAAEKANVADFVKKSAAKPTGRRVAVVGSGPAGLTAAYYLTRLGHSVTVFEKEAKPGGMLNVIPRFLLPESIIKGEIDCIVDAGIGLKLNSPVKDIDQLLKNGYDAVMLATGAGAGQKLRLPGADLEGVLVSLAFLKDANEGKKIKVGKKVLVIGGGNVAVDVARVARRLGAASVSLVCLESRENLPAFSWEIEEAEKEGIEVQPSRTVTRILAKNGHVSGVECLKLRHMEFDEQGNLSIDSIAGSEHQFEADTVIFAIGQIGSTEIVAASKDITSKRGRIVANMETLKTGREGVFAGGDTVNGPASVIEAIAAGRKAASAIDLYLGGKGDIEEKLAPAEAGDTSKMPTPVPVGFGKKREVPTLAVEERLKGFPIVEQTLTEEGAVEQASRCLQCDLPILVDCNKCIGCVMCQLRCSLRLTGAVQPSKAAVKITENPEGEGPLYNVSFTDECDTCGLCVKYCPTSALRRGAMPARDTLYRD
ncbi:FAD-dependent oxidoreductase [Chloroflexota bacterium]